MIKYLLEQFGRSNISFLQAPEAFGYDSKGDNGTEKQWPHKQATRKKNF
jgi:hypothetical protein